MSVTVRQHPEAQVSPEHCVPVQAQTGTGCCHTVLLLLSQIKWCRLQREVLFQLMFLLAVISMLHHYIVKADILKMPLMLQSIMDLLQVTGKHKEINFFLNNYYG